MTLPLPAILGGAPERPAGPPGWPRPDPRIAFALQQAYADGSWGKYCAQHVEHLHSLLGNLHQVPYVLTCSSGTLAIEWALRACQVGPGCEVLLAAYDYEGNFLACHATGAKPVLVDVQPDSWTLTRELLEVGVTPATKAVIVSHLHGSLAPMPEVQTWAQRRRILVIEDAAQCPGATLAGRLAGSWGDVGVLSFGGSKLLTSGRGGALLTSSAQLHQRLKLLAQRATNEYCALSELQAAVLVPQVEQLADLTVQRHTNVAWLQDALREVPGLVPLRSLVPGTPGYYKVGWQYSADEFGLSRPRLLAAMQAEGIACHAGFRALHVGRAPSRFRAPGPLMEAERAHANAVLLHHPVLLGEREELAQIVRAFRKIHEHAGQIEAD